MGRGLIFSLVAVAWLALCATLYAAYPPSPDQWFLDYTGWMVANGAVPYRTFLDGVWPMGHWLHALSTLLFGTGLSAWRYFDFGFLVVCTMFGADLARRLWGRASGAWFLFLYPPLYIVNSTWFEGERDLVAANAGLIVLWTWLRGVSVAQPRWQIATGLAIAFAALIKPTFLALGLALAAHAALGVSLRRLRPHAALAHVAMAGAATGVGLGLGFAALVAGGSSLDSFFDLGVRSVGSRFGNDVVSVGEAISELARAYLLSWHWIGAGALASLFWRLRRGDAFENLLLPLAWLAGAASYFAQGQALYYTLGPVWSATIPILCSGLGLATEEWRVTSGWRRALLSLLLGVAVAGTAKKLWTIHGDTLRMWAGAVSLAELQAASTVGDEISTADALALAAELRARVPVGETVLVWGRANAINVLAERPQATRFHHYVHLLRPYLPRDLAERWSLWFEEDLERSRPRYCLVNHRFVEGLPEPRPRAARFLAEYLERDYVALRRIGESTLYERKR